MNHQFRVWQKEGKNKRPDSNLRSLLISYNVILKYTTSFNIRSLPSSRVQIRKGYAWRSVRMQNLTISRINAYVSDIGAGRTATTGEEYQISDTQISFRHSFTFFGLFHGSARQIYTILFEN